MTDVNRTNLANAMSALAARCDGARELDGIGFNGTDAKFGRRVAEMGINEWNDELTVTCAHVLRKYANQLKGYGIDVTADIAAVLANRSDSDIETISRDGHDLARQAEYKRKNAPYIAIENGNVAVFNSYPIKGILSSNKFIWTRLVYKAWASPLNHRAAQTILGIGEIKLTDEQRKILMSIPPDETDESEQINKSEIVNVTIHPRDSRKLILNTEYGRIPLAVTQAMPGRYWNAAKKVNEMNAHPAILELVEKYHLTISDDAIARIEENRAAIEALIEKSKASAIASYATDSDVPMALRNQLRPYQRAGVAYAMSHNNRVIFGDEMGLGKTRQALSAMESREAYPAIIVCPAGLTLNWEREIRNLLPNRTVSVYFGKNYGTRMRLTSEITIISYNVLESYLPIIHGMRTLICDESHYIKNANAGRTKAVLMMCGKYGIIPTAVKKGETPKPIPVYDCLTDDAGIYFLSGTPMVQRPIELVAQLVALGELSTTGMVYEFKNRYCVKVDAHGIPETTFGHKNYNGARNLPELNEYLRGSRMVRRLKKDVLKDLPPKVRSHQFIALTDSAMEEYLDLARKGLEYAETTKAKQIVYLNKLRDAIGKAVLSQAIEWAADFLETGKPLIIFANHIHVQHSLITALKGIKDENGNPDKYNVTQILGGQNAGKSEDAKTLFQNGDSKVIVLSLSAAREGHTLTAASDVLFVEFGWNSSTHDQAEDRAHRMGQTDSVTAWYLVGQDTIAEWLFELIEAKRKVVSVGTNGEGATAEYDDEIMTELFDRAQRTYG